MKDPVYCEIEKELYCNKLALIIGQTQFCCHLSMPTFANEVQYGLLKMA